MVREGQLEEGVAIFLNRLSDYLFVAARYASMKCKMPEEIYKKAKVPKSEVSGGKEGGSKQE